MSTLTEIEAAVSTLPEQEQEQLLQNLAARLHRLPVSGARDPMKNVVTNPRTGLPLIHGTPGVTINPTKEQLGNF